MRAIQTAYEGYHAEVGPALARDPVWTAMYRYLVDDLGLDETFADRRAALELKGDIPRAACDEIEKSGFCFAGKRVLDLGAGLGGLSAEMGKRGATIVSIEPGTAWRTLAGQRLAGMRNVSVVGAVGEHLPIAGDSIDLIASLQVLEHVTNPRSVIVEAFRVLKPGGYMFASFENYFSFWEPHYKVRWLPLLPKRIGALYLKALGRNPKFLRDAVTYTTFAGVRHTFFRAGFECMRLRATRDSLAQRRPGMKGAALNLVAAISRPAALRLLSAADYSRRFFRSAVREYMRKPIRQT